MATRVFELVVEWDDLDPSEGKILSSVQTDEGDTKALPVFEFDAELPASEQLRRVLAQNIGGELRLAGVR